MVKSGVFYDRFPPHCTIKPLFCQYCLHKITHRHVANVNVGRSNRLTRFKQCIALARITSHLCGVYLFIGGSISSMHFASARRVLHRFVQGWGTVSVAIIRASCTVFLRLVVRNARCFKLMHNAQ